MLSKSAPITYCKDLIMNINEFARLLSYNSSIDHPHARNPKFQATLHNVAKSFILLVPIVNTIFGIVLLAMTEVAKRRGFQPPDYLYKVIVASFCIASMGILLLPLMIKGTLAKNQGQGPGLTNRAVKQVPPDYLL